MVPLLAALAGTLIIATPEERADARLLELSLSAAQTRAEGRAPDVRLAVGSLRTAEATRVGAGLRVPVNPRLSIDGRPGLDPSHRDKVGFGSTLEVVVEPWDTPGARLREAHHRALTSRAAVQVARLDARLRALGLYVGIRLGDLRILQARSTIVLAERLNTAARERLGSGAGSDIDVTSAQVELAERRSQLHEAQAEREVLLGELRDLLVIPPETQLRLTSDVEEPPPTPPLPRLLARARSGHPALHAISERIGLLAASDERLRKEAQPKIGFFASVDASPASPVFGVLGLSVELPLFQRAQGPRAVVAAERQLELDRFDVTTRRLDQLLRATHAAYGARLAELAVLTQEGVPAAEQRVRLVEEGWRAGRFDVFRLTTAAQDLARLRAKRIEVLERLWHERMVLERLTGEWNDDRS